MMVITIRCAANGGTKSATKRSSAGRHFRDRSPEHRDIDRLGEVAGKSRRRTLLPVGIYAKSAERDAPQAIGGGEIAHHFGAAAIRQSQVAHHEIDGATGHLGLCEPQRAADAVRVHDGLREVRIQRTGSCNAKFAGADPQTPSAAA
jgi:hypothetical protein